MTITLAMENQELFTITANMQKPSGASIVDKIPQRKRTPYQENCKKNLRKIYADM